MSKKTKIIISIVAFIATIAVVLSLIVITKYIDKKNKYVETDYNNTSIIITNSSTSTVSPTEWEAEENIPKIISISSTDNLQVLDNFDLKCLNKSTNDITITYKDKTTRTLTIACANGLEDYLNN